MGYTTVDSMITKYKAGTCTLNERVYFDKLGKGESIDMIVSVSDISYKEGMYDLLKFNVTKDTVDNFFTIVSNNGHIVETISFNYIIIGRYKGG